MLWVPTRTEQRLARPARAVGGDYERLAYQAHKAGGNGEQAADLPRRIYEGLEQVLGQPIDEITRRMDVLIGEWKIQARGVLTKFGYDASWLNQET